MKSMKISDYFKIINPNYQYIKITPSSAIKDYNSENLSVLANQTYKKLFDRISFNEKKMIIEAKSSIKYLICISKNEVKFYYIVPQVHVSLALEVISKCWNNKATATVVDESEINVLENPTTYEMRYKYEDFMSINTDSKSNKFLAKTLAVIDIMEAGDEVQIALNLIPMNRNYVSWSTYFDDMKKKYESGAPIFKDKKSIGHIFGLLRFFLYDILAGLFDEIQNTFASKKDKNEIANNYSYRKLSTASTNKRDAGERLVDTQLVVMSKSQDVTREGINAKAVCNSFNEVKDGNEFVYKKTKAVIDIKKRAWPVSVNIMDARENANFISIPGQSILDEIKIIEHVATHEVVLLEEFTKGVSVLGTSEHKGKLTTAYLNDYKEFAFLPIIVMTKMGGGKSTWFETVGVSLMNSFKKTNKKESIFCIDFIKQNEVSYNIMYNIDAQDIIKIDVTNPEDIAKFGFGFNEIEIDLDNKEKRLKASSLQAKEMMKLINAANEDDADPLSPSMKRYLNSAFTICYIHANQSLRDAMRIIEHQEIRHEYIEKIPIELREELDDEVRALLELDKEDGSTDANKIKGIMSRVYTITDDPTLKAMYKVPVTNNINLAEEIQKGKAIFVLMPDDESSDMLIDIITTYCVSKLFFACKQRAKKYSKSLTRCTLIIDEVGNAPGCLETLNKMLTKLRKYRLRPIFSAHNWGQIKKLKQNLIDGGLSIILPQGSNKENFKEFQEDFNKDGFEVEDLLKLKQFQTLNLMQSTKGRVAFISKFPAPVPGKIEDREDVDLEEFKNLINNRINKLKPIEEQKVKSENVIKVDFTKIKKEEIIEEIKENVIEVIEDVIEVIEDDFEIIEDDFEVVNFEFDIKQLLLPPPKDDDANSK